MKHLEIDLLTVESWEDVFDHFGEQYGFRYQKPGLPGWMEALREATEEETLLVIRNPMLGFGNNQNKFRDIILQIATVLNSERYAEGRNPTIKMAFTQG